MKISRRSFLGFMATAAAFTAIDAPKLIAAAENSEWIAPEDIYLGVGGIFMTAKRFVVGPARIYDVFVQDLDGTMDLKRKNSTMSILQNEVRSMQVWRWIAAPIIVPEGGRVDLILKSNDKESLRQAVGIMQYSRGTVPRSNIFASLNVGPYFDEDEDYA